MNVSCLSLPTLIVAFPDEFVVAFLPAADTVAPDTGSPASTDYGPTGNKFTGTIDWVKLDIGADSHDHLITAEDKLNISMARQ